MTADGYFSALNQNVMGLRCILKHCDGQHYSKGSMRMDLEVGRHISDDHLRCKIHFSLIRLMEGLKPEISIPVSKRNQVTLSAVDNLT
jgi:hypothetical protein